MSGTPTTRHVPGPKAGDERRAALLTALEELLESRPLAEVGVSDISRSAGVTRSAFYFYFPSKAAAVAALLADFHDEMFTAAAGWYEGDSGSPLQRLREAMGSSAARWREHEALMVALLDASGSDADARSLWEEWIEGWVEQVVARIREDQASGTARDEIDVRPVAEVLVGAVFHAMERDVRGIRAGRPPSDDLVEALVDVWSRALYVGGSRA